MRFFILAMILVFPSLVMAMSFPTADGTYVGTGSFTKLSDTSVMTYEVSYVFDSPNDLFSVSYVYANGFSYKLAYKIIDGANGTFTIKTLTGTVAGSGNCLAKVCQWNLNYIDSQFGTVQEWGVYLFDDHGGLAALGQNYSTSIIFTDRSQLVRR